VAEEKKTRVVTRAENRTDLEKFRAVTEEAGVPGREQAGSEFDGTLLQVNLSGRDDHDAERLGELTVLEFDHSGRLVRMDGRTVGPWSQKARLVSVFDEAGVDYDTEDTESDSTLTVEPDWTNGDGREHRAGDIGFGSVFLFDERENLVQVGGYDHDRPLTAGTKDIDEDDPCALCQDEVLPGPPSDCPSRDCAETITDIDEDDSDQS